MDSLWITQVCFPNWYFYHMSELQEIQSNIIKRDTYESRHKNVSQIPKRIMSSSEKIESWEKCVAAQREEVYLYLTIMILVFAISQVIRELMVWSIVSKTNEVHQFYHNHAMEFYDNHPLKFKFSKTKLVVSILHSMTTARGSTPWTLQGGAIPLTYIILLYRIIIQSYICVPSAYTKHIT